MDLVDYKRKLEINVDSLLEVMNELIDISEYDYKNQELKNSLDSIRRITKDWLDKINKILFFFKKEAEWDTFNVAFFGETNAGKSTIIEALIKGDGSSIGEGYKDHTKRIVKHNFGKINFLDMPGIEGREKIFENEIKKAIEKSHLIFYVLTTKEPEEGTLEKIRKYLKSRTKVFSILNIRGKPGIYRLYRTKELIDNNIRLIESNTIMKLSKTLGKSYHGNLSLNAYIAFLASGKPEREDFKKDLKKAIEVFGDLKLAYEFSNFDVLENTIRNQNARATYEIIISNTYKVLDNIEKILREIIGEKKKFDKIVNKIYDETKKTFENLRTTVNEYKNSINHLVESNIENLRIRVNKVVNEGIDNDLRKEELERKVKEILDETKFELNELINKKMSELSNELNSTLEELNIHLEIYLSHMKSNQFDIEKIIEKTKIGIGYVFKQTVETVFYIVSIIIISNPIVAVIVGVLALIKKIWDWLFGDPNKRKREAKEKAFQEIDKKTRELSSQSSRSLKKGFRQIDKELKYQNNEVFSYLKQFKSISKKLNTAIAEIKSIKVDISSDLVRYISRNDQTLSYIDLELSKILVIGYFDRSKEELFRVKEILRVPSIVDFCNLAEAFKIEDRLIVGKKDEFIYRAISSLWKQLDISIITRNK